MGKPRGANFLHDVQNRRRGVLTAVAVLFVAIFALVTGSGGWTQTTVVYLGRLAICAAILGRCWCTLYIGGRKAQQLVDTGPYSVCRNPLSFFSFVGTAGFAAQTGSAVVTVLFTVVVWIVFRRLVGREEAHLKGALGEPYAHYLTTTPRFLPNPALWRGVDVLEVQPRLVIRTFVDGLVFLVAVPLALGFGWLHAADVLPVLLRLP